MRKNNLALVEESNTKENAIYIRIDPKTLDQIKSLQKKHKHRTRSNTIRAIIRWAFDNGVSSV